MKKICTIMVVAAFLLASLYVLKETLPGNIKHYIKNTTPYAILFAYTQKFFYEKDILYFSNNYNGMAKFYSNEGVDSAKSYIAHGGASATLPIQIPKRLYLIL